MKLERAARVHRLTWLLAVVVPLIGCRKAPGNLAEAESIAAITRLGGKVEVDENDPEHPAIKVYLHDTAATDADLAALEKLTKLRNLFLGRTQITDAGLEHVKRLAQLRTLSLNVTRVTDVGLKHLAGLSHLKTLNLQETKVTSAGADELRRLLPGLSIAR